MQWAGTEYENSLRSAGYMRVAGIDEVGRGPLAGPVVACAMMLPEDHGIVGLADSKLLTNEQRRELVPQILGRAVAWGIGVIDSTEIDRINIFQATLAAMRLAMSKIECDALIVDGKHRIPGLDVHQQATPKADAMSVSVAAASIVAKVTRDDMMTDLDPTYPGYGFAQHKGYATKSHFDALVRLGPCPIHRQTFLGPWRGRQEQGTLEFSEPD